MLEELYYIDRKVKKNHKKRPTHGTVNGAFGQYIDSYPQLVEDTDSYWQFAWHKERCIRYYRDEIFWLSETLYTKDLYLDNTIFLNLEYYCLVESIIVYSDYTGDEHYATINFVSDGEEHTEQLANHTLTLTFNKVVMLGEKISLSSLTNSVIAQVNYRLIG